MNWYFFGHHRCGTTWVRDILKHLCPVIDANMEVVRASNLGFVWEPTRPHRFICYPNATSDDYEIEGRGFHVLRDPRDALVSDYFSRRYSHSISAPKFQDLRDTLNTMSVEEGLFYMLDCDYYSPGYMRSRDYKLTGGNILDIKYEDLLRDTRAVFRRVLDHLEISVADADLSDVINKCAFESVTRRKPGEENIHSHRRKASPGDWKNYIKGDLAAAVDKKFGDLISALDY